ncbi:MAG: ABC transporter ATP-binding protein [Alphaproteobacteria bacterium]|nr:ABC transporter ATP-binding protein [Alphaproteobacteria bacterium]MCB9791514.1 ABC transporter ATP-binding protein [Alphaproteobacteria bacterium]
MSELISIRGLKARRGGFTLEVPEWTVRPGRVVGVVGPNGAGKTTLLRTLPGLDGVDAGAVRVLGFDPRHEPAAVRAQLGFMSDELPVFDQRLHKLLRQVSGYYPSWDAALVEQLVERFQLDLSKRPRELSKGQGTRLRLLLAMAFRPKVLVLDEPATGLDVSGRQQLLEAVLDIASDPERAVIVSSHMLTDVERIADELLVLSGGKVVQQGETDTLVGDARTLEEALVAWGAA